MADNTKIEWADATWNPVVGCTKASPGCAHCYAESFARRQRVSSSYEPGKATIRCFPERLGIPLRWKKPRRVFVCSLADLFHEQVPLWFAAKVFAMAVQAPQHEYMILTKRADRMEEFLKSDTFWWRVAHGGQDGQRNGHDENVHQLPNVELGVSIENEYWKEKRLPHLMATPASRRFVSYEPALGAVDWRPYLFGCACPTLDYPTTSGTHNCKRLINQVICGGESGPRARPMHPDWPRRVRDQCVAAGVSFMFKQWGEWLPDSQLPDVWTFGRADIHRWPDGSFSHRVGKKVAGAVLDGREWPMAPTGGR